MNYRATLERRFRRFFSFFITLLIVGLAANQGFGFEEPSTYYTPSAPKNSADFEQRLSQGVKEFEYSDQVAQDFVAMVRKWNCEDIYTSLSYGLKAVSHRKKSWSEYALSEELVVDRLAQQIVKEIGKIDAAEKSGCYYSDLNLIVQEKKTQCLGYAQIYFLLGNAMGLNVRGIDVEEHAMGRMPIGEKHAACLVDLHNGKTMQVDLTLRRLSTPSYKIKDEYEQDGSFWKQKKESFLTLHRRIQILDQKGLASLVFVNRGKSHLIAEQNELGLADYTRAIELNPNNAIAYHSRGCVYCQLGKPQESIADYTKAIELYPQDAENYVARGAAYLQMREFTKSLSDLGKASEIDPDILERLNRAKETKTREDKLAITRADFKKATQFEPQDAEGYCHRGFAYSHLRQPEKALADFNKALELNPKYAKAYDQRGIIYAQGHQTALALADFDKAIELDPKLPEAYNHRGITFNEAGQPEKALPDFGKAIELRPNYCEAYNNRGNAYGKLQKYMEALADFDKAIELNPQFPNPYAGRGLTNANLGKMEEAKKDFRKALELNPQLQESVRKAAGNFKLDI